MAQCRPITLLSLVLWIFCLKAVAALPQALEQATELQDSRITFYVYPTLEEKDSPLTDGIDALKPSQPLTMVFHGFKGDHTAKSMQSIKEALLLNGVENVVVVDWGPLADSSTQSALNAYHHVRDYGVPETANFIVQWITSVMEKKNITSEQIHLIGFSLGGHVVGIVGHMLNSTIGKITGLDPPKFGYESVHVDQRLDSADAQFVNVIHTSAGILSYTEPIAHVDFFPNGDMVPQHGCPHDNPLYIITCSHYFAFVVLSETIFNSKAFMATECDSWHSFTHGECEGNKKAPMGYYTPNTTRGMFFIKTAEKLPFGEEDSGNPLPDSMLKLLVYDKSDSIVNPADVVNFLMHKEPTEQSADLEVDDTLSSEDQLENDTKVMKVKSAKATTTTEDPPSFLNSSGFSQAIDFIALLLTGANAARALFG